MVSMNGEYLDQTDICAEAHSVVIKILGVVMEELQPCILVRLDGVIARVGCPNIRTRELERELTILETNKVVLS